MFIMDSSSLSIRNRMANCADPNQTAPKEQSDQGLHCLFRQFCPSFMMNTCIMKNYSCNCNC